MAHKITHAYGQLGKSKTWNNYLYRVLPTGFLTDVSLSKITSTEVSISTFTAWITDSANEVSVRIEGTSTETGIDISSSKPYIIIRLNWTNNSNNDFTITNVALGSIQTNDLVIGKGNFTGPVLNSFDYSLQTINPLKNFGSTNIVTKTGAYTATISDDIILCDGTFTIDLPSITNNEGEEIIIKNIGTGTITIDGYGSENIDGSTTQTINTQYDSLRLIVGASEWYII